LKKSKPYLFVSAFLLSGWLLSSHTPLPINTESNQSIVSEDIQQPFVKVLDLTLTDHTWYRDIDFNFRYTSFIFEVSRQSDFTLTSYFTTENDAFKLDSLPQTDQPGDERRSPFVVPNLPQDKFSFYSGKLEGKVRIYLYYAPPIKIEYPNSLGKKNQEFCSKPSMVLGKTWRKGLPDPVGTRERHDVKHCIVHHAASSNTNHDYVNVVRNIFLLHTQTNGWDDIGYNYIIAQNGSIFEGREHQDIDSSDNIKGAHFCGKNTNTLGLCLLGNYQDMSPSQPTIESLTHLLTWKCFLDDISSMGESPHPSQVSPKLAHVAGHRDGCATACPGDSMYPLLPELRNVIDSLVKICLPLKQNDVVPRISTLAWFQEKESNNIVVKLDVKNHVSQVTLMDVAGQLIREKQMAKSEKEIRFKNLPQGVYILTTTSPNKMMSSQKIEVR
jgi:hypothetical protein